MKAAQLIERLSSGDEGERYEAVARLADGLCRQAAPNLVLLLRDRSEAVCAAAVVALAELGGPESRAPLEEIARHEQSWSLRERAIWALGYRGEPESESVLRAIMAEDSSVRKAAAQALARLLGHPVELPPTEREMAAQHRDRDEIPGLLQILESDAPDDERIVAAESLSQIADSGASFPELIQPLFQALQDPNNEVRACAQLALAAQSALTPAPAKEQLRAALADCPEMVFSLGRWGLEEAAPELLRRSASQDPFEASAACQILAELDHDSALHHMAEAVGRVKLGRPARIFAARYLGRRSQWDALIGALEACDPQEDGDLIQALAQAMGDPSAGKAVPSLRKAYQRCHPKAQKRKPTDFLARRDVEEHYYQIASQLLAALGRTGDPSIEPLLLEELRSPHAGLRAQAATALAGWESPAAREALRQACQDPHPRVAAAAQRSQRA